VGVCGSLLVFSLRFLKSVMVVEFYEVMHAMEETQRIGLTNV